MRDLVSGVNLTESTEADSAAGLEEPDGVAVNEAELPVHSRLGQSEEEQKQVGEIASDWEKFKPYME